MEASGEYQYSMVKFISLYSGSDKNSSVFSYRNTNIMIDCGGSFKQLCAQLDKVDMKITDIDGIFLTHSHSDHIKALPMIIILYHKMVLLEETLFS